LREIDGNTLGADSKTGVKDSLSLVPPTVLVNNAGVIRDNLLFKVSEPDSFDEFQASVAAQTPVRRIGFGVAGEYGRDEGAGRREQGAGRPALGGR
jgi:hypothetical protein